MPFNVLSWALGFALSRTVGRILDKTAARSFADNLRDAVLEWASSLPDKFRDLNPDALASHLFESDLQELGPKRKELQSCFGKGKIPGKKAWFDAIKERRKEVYADLGEDAQNFFKAAFGDVKPHIDKLAKILHQQCIKNEDLFKVSLYEMVRELLERQEKPRPERRPRPADGLGVLSNVPSLPDKFVARPEYLEPLKQKLMGKSAKAVAVTAEGRRKVGVQGMGGIGKTVLAAAAVREKEVRKAYPDGIIWLTFGQEPNIIARQVQLARVLGDQQAAFQDVQQGKTRLEELLADLECLVVLDDIWKAHHAAAFDVPGKKGRILITTRFANIVGSLGAQEQRLDVLEEDQAFALLARWAGTTVEELPILSAHEVVKECGGLPLALAMIGAMIQRRPERWEDAVERLRGANIDKIKRDFPDYPYPDLLRAIEVSIDGLDEVKDRYLDFAIFPEDTPIPEAVLQTLWQADGLDKHDVRDTLVVLEDRSMLRRDEKGRITLHDLQFDYVRKQARVALADRHAKLIEAYRAQCKDAWYTAPDDGYFYQHSAYHFFQAGRQDELRELLFDYRLLRKKVEVTDPNEVLADYAFIADDPQLQLVQSAIRLSIGALAKDGSYLASQLYGRLLSAKGKPVQSLLDETSNSQVHPWLRPMTPSLTAPGGPLVWTLFDHEGSVNAVAVTGDGRYAVSGSNDKMLKVWDLQSGAVLRTLAGHEGPVNAVAVTHDAQYAVSGSDDRTLKVWDLQSGAVVHTLWGSERYVNAVAVTGDGRYAVSGSRGKALKVWDLQSGSVVRTLAGHEGPVKAVAVTGDGRYAVSGSNDKTLKVWDLQSGSLIHTLSGHEGYVSAVAVMGDGRYAASASWDQTLKVWDLQSGSVVRTLAGHQAEVHAVAVTRDGRYAVSGSGDKTLKVWDLHSGSLFHTLSDHAAPVAAVAVTGDGRYAVSGSGDKTLKVWDLQSGSVVHRFSRHEDRVAAVAVTGDGRYAVSGSWDKTVKVWDLQSGSVVHTFVGHEDWVHAVFVTGDGRYAVSGSGDKTLKVWDLQSGSVVRTLAGHEGPVMAVAVTGDARYAVSGSNDETLKVWDLANSSVVHTLLGHEVQVLAVVVTGDGRYAVSGSYDQTLKVWDLQSGAVVRTLSGHEDVVTAVAVTGDGRQVVSGSHDRTLKVWDLQSGLVVRTLTGHESYVNAVAVTGDGRYAVSGSDDRALKVWDLATGRVEAGFCGEAWVLCCAVAPDGRTIVAGDKLGRVHFLRLENVTPDKSAATR